MTSPAITLTADLLSRLGACEGQVAIVRGLYPDRVDVSRRGIARLVRAGVTGWDWARVLLAPEAERARDAAAAEARRAYDAALAKARRVYDAATAEAWRGYAPPAGRGGGGGGAAAPPPPPRRPHPPGAARGGGRGGGRAPPRAGAAGALEPRHGSAVAAP